MERSLFRGACCAALVFLAFSVSPSADAFVTKHTPSGATVHWKSESVVWLLDPTVADVPGGGKAFRDGVTAWNAAGTGAPSMRVATSKATRAPGLDGVSGLYYVKDGFAPAGRALAVTILNIDDATGAILDADVVLNGLYDLEAISSVHADAHATVENEHDATPGAVFDVRRVAAHELGHALGLADAPDESSALMYPFVAPGIALPAAPQADDLSGLSSIYEGPPNPTTTPSSPPGCAVARAAPHFALATPALVLVLVLVLVLAPVLASVLARVRSSRGRSRGPFPLGASAGSLPLASSRHPLALGAFAALLAAPPLASAPVSPAAEHVRVARVRTVSEAGIFRSEIGLANGVHTQMWGGVLGGIRQEIGGRAALREGDVVEIVSDARGAIALRRVTE